MSKLSDTIARHLQLEIGVIRKEHGGRLRICLVYPNTYSVGMSSLGFQAIYHLFNSRPDIVCERAFVPEAGDLSDLQRTASPLTSYESQTPLSRFDIIAFSISYELDYVNVARVLRLAKLPVMSRDRGRHLPLVIVGGAAASINPEPLAELVDLFVIGEAEPVYERLLTAFGRHAEKIEMLREAASIPGIYVPDGGHSHARPTIVRQYACRLADWPTYSRLLTPEAEFGDLFLVEVSRGCGRGCRFCIAPACYWPLRWRPAANILEAVRIGLQHREAVGLIGAASSDHPEIDGIAACVVSLGARLSVSSLRADSMSPRLLDALAKSGTRSITLAPEAGSDRLRAAIGKVISGEQIVEALRMASASGIREAKLYFMVGLPGETADDLTAIPDLVRRCLRVGDLHRLTVALASFVPKPHTPYEREGMLSATELSRRLRTIREQLRGERHVALAVESANWSYLEGALSRGDRRLGQVIVRAEEAGGNLAAWRRAFEEAGLTPELFGSAIAEEETVPWAFIRSAREEKEARPSSAS